MILNLDRWASDAVAAIDAQGNLLTYGELRNFAESFGHCKSPRTGKNGDYKSPQTQMMPARSLFFLLVENNMGGIAWTIGNICAGNVPLILNAHLDQALYNIELMKKPPVEVKPKTKTETKQKKIIKSYNRQIVFPTKRIETEEQLDSYVEQIRSQLKMYMQGCDGIEIK